jgi:IS6 family transposase
VPAQERLGLDEEARPAGPGQDAADRREQGPVGRLQPGSRRLAAQDDELVAQDEDLEIFGGVAMGELGDELAEAARPCRHTVGDRWQVDATYVKVAGRWRDVSRAIDQPGQVIDVFLSTHRDAAAARRFFKQAITTTKVTPMEVVTDRALAYLTVLDDLLEATWHRTERYANNPVAADHGRRKQESSASMVIAGHGFVQNLRRGHYELAIDEPVTQRVAVAFDELALAI